MDKQQIINFAVNNDRFDLLKTRINRFNPLKILKVQDHELRHSNILAWILNPNENHNFDDWILKRFLLKVLLKPVNDEVLDNLEMVYQLQYSPLKDVKVFREMGHIDLLLVSDQQRKVIFIENKVYSGEHSDQLLRYYNYVKEKYPYYQLIPIFLTLDGIKASQENYFAASYIDVMETIEFMIDNYRDRTSSEIILFLEQYTLILKEKYVMDVELKKLCKEIYQQNKDIIDLIFSVGNEIDIEPAVLIFTRNYPDIVMISLKSRTFCFALEAFKKGQIQSTDSWGGGFPVYLWFSEYNAKLKITFEVGPFEDFNKRVVFLNKLETSGIKTSERAKEIGRKYTRIYTNTHSIKDWTDNEEIADVMEKLYKEDEIVKMRHLVAQVINEFTW